MPVLSHLHQLFNAEQCQHTSVPSGGKIARCNVGSQEQRPENVR